MALPPDELELISKKLTFAPDYTRLRSVCKAWRTASPKKPQLPWLIANTRSCSKFYQFSFEANEFTQIPELSRSSLLSSFLDDPHVSIRSSHGWLFLHDLNTKSVSLINPITDSIINLPNLHIANRLVSKYEMQGNTTGFCLTSDPGESLADCFAFVYSSGSMYYCKIGSSVWSEVQHPEIDGRGKVHICCYSGKLFLALRADVFVCEFGDNPSICKLVPLGLRLMKLKFLEPYLVESDGDLLLVLVFGTGYFKCKVFKLEFGEQQAKLVKLKCLGGRTLFLGLDTTFSLDASKYPGCRKNSIYMPEFTGVGGFETNTIIPTLMIYDWEEGYCIPLPNNDHPFGNWIPSAWFRPSLLT